MSDLTFKQLVDANMPQPYRQEGMAMSLVQADLKDRYLYASPSRPLWQMAIANIFDQQPFSDPKTHNIGNEVRYISTREPLHPNVIKSNELVLSSQSAVMAHLDSLVSHLVENNAPITITTDGGLTGATMSQVEGRWDCIEWSHDEDMQLVANTTTVSSPFKGTQLLNQVIQRITEKGIPSVSFDTNDSARVFVISSIQEPAANTAIQNQKPQAESGINSESAASQPAAPAPASRAQTSSKQSESVHKWIDASELKIHLGFTLLPDHKTTVLALINGASEPIDDALMQIGFRQSESYSGVYFSIPQGGVAELNPIFKALKSSVSDPSKVRPKVMTMAEIINGVDQAISQQTQIPSLKLLAAQAESLALNAASEIIWSTPNGRMVTATKQSNAILGAVDLQPIMEDVNNPSPRFGRLDEGGAGHAQLVAMGAQLFTSAATSSHLSKPDTIDRIEALKNTVNEGRAQPFTQAEFEECMERAMVLSLERFSMTASSTQAITDFAKKLHSIQPSMTAVSSSKMALQQFSTPLHLSVAMQSILGTRDQLAGKSILDPTVGHGSLLAAYAGSSSRYGVELDPTRIARMADQATAPEIVRGDAMVANFRDLFGVEDGFDRVIVNPPFGDTGKNHSIPLPMGSAEPTIGLRKLDHIIALNALHARADQGRSVFIMGADSVVNPTATETGTRRLLQYVSEHYDGFQAAVVDGSIYKEQGAGWPLVVVSMGDRRPEPVLQSSITTLPLLSNIQEIEQWAKSAIHAIENPVTVTADFQQNVSQETPSQEPVETPRFVPTIPDLFSDLPSVQNQLQTEPEVDSPAITGSEPEVQPETAPETQAKTPEVDQSEPVVDAQVDVETKTETQTPVQIDEDSLYVPYVAVSKVGAATTMVPVNMAAPVYKHLQSIHEKHIDIGGLDAYVASEMKWTLEELSDGRLSPEQVDALAMAMDANSINQDFLLGDTVGTGKGRVLAAFMAWKQTKGAVPVFCTATANLFSDMLARDMDDIGVRDRFKNPLILNNGEYIVDVDGTKIKPLKPEQQNEMFDSGKLPEGVDIVFATYSQFTKAPEAARGGKRTQFLLEITANQNAVPILDEAHLAAGESRTGENMKLALNNAYSNGHRTIAASGSAIKGAANLSIYSGVIPGAGKVMSHEEILKAVKVSPNDMQEALMSEIAKTGLSRVCCHDTSHYRRDYVPSATPERNREYSDKFAVVLRRMMYMAGEVNHIVGEMNQNFAKDAKALEEAGADVERFGAKGINFGSRLFQINKAFVLALSMDDVAERTLHALRNNEKPVVALHLTGGALLNDFLSEQEALDDPAAAEFISERRVMDKPLDFKDLLHKYLERIGTIKVMSSYGNYTTVRPAETSGEYREAEAEVAKLINEMPDLPMLPIDHLRHKIQEAGYKISEITGRSNVVDKRVDGTYEIVPRKGAISKAARREIAKEFNNGQTDVLVINAAGSTGLSLHSSPSEGSDTRRRVMIFAEMQLDVATQRQISGRIGRRGEVNEPRYEFPILGLPSQDRLMMMFNGKNRSLSSSSTSNRDNENNIDECPDLLNAVGGLSAKKMLEADQTLCEYLSIELPDEKSEWPLLQYASRLSGHMSLLQIDQQERTYEAWNREFDVELAALEAKGENPLKSKVMDVKARLMHQEVMIGDPDNISSDSIFDRPVLLSTYEYDEYIEPLTFDDVLASIEKNKSRMAIGLNSEGVAETQREVLIEHREQILSRYLPKKFKTVDDALNDKESNRVKSMSEDIDFLVTRLPAIKMGSLINYSDWQGNYRTAVVTRVKPPEAPADYGKLGLWDLQLAEIGASRERTVTLAGLKHAPDLSINVPRMPIEQNKNLREQFDQQVAGVVKRKARILEGNLFLALSQATDERLGAKITFTRDDLGNSEHRHHGVLVKNDDKSLQKLLNMYEPVREPSLMLHLLNTTIKSSNSNRMEYVRLSTDRTPKAQKGSSDYKQIFTLQRDDVYGRDGFYTFKVPSTKKYGGDIITDPVLTSIPGQEDKNKFNLAFNERSNQHHFVFATVHVDQMPQFIMHLQNKHGLNFYADPKIVSAARKEIKAAAQENKVNQQEVVAEV